MSRSRPASRLLWLFATTLICWSAVGITKVSGNVNAADAWLPTSSSSYLTETDSWGQPSSTTTTRRHGPQQEQEPFVRIEASEEQQSQQSRRRRRRQRRLQQYTTNEFNSRTAPCPDDPNEVGYLTLKDFELDQETELQRLALGGAPFDAYVVPLCPDMRYVIDDGNTQDFPGIRALLGVDMTFVCGNGQENQNCVIEGGTEPLFVESFIVPRTVELIGMTFTNFEGPCTRAAPYGRLVFRHVHFEGLTGGNNQIVAATEDLTPLNDNTPLYDIELSSCFISGNVISYYYSLSGSPLLELTSGKSQLTLDLIVAFTVTARSLVHLQGGSTATVKDISMQQCNFAVVFDIQGGSSLDVSSLAFVQSQYLNTLFSIEESSTADLRQVQMLDSQFSAANDFTFLYAASNSIVTSSAIEMSNVTGVFVRYLCFEMILLVLPSMMINIIIMIWTFWFSLPPPPIISLSFAPSLVLKSP